MARQQLFSPFQSYVAGRDARQQYELGQTRNKLAELELADAPAQMQRRNALADTQLQGAQLGVQSAQQQLSADQAKFAYAKLKQAADSGNPKAFITQNIPDLAAKLQQQGIDLNSMDDQSVAQLTENLARKYAGEAGIAPAQPKTPEAFTLGAGQTRFGPDGKPIASAPASTAMTPYQEERLRIEREKLNKPSADTGPLVQVAGPDGNPVYATRENAVGKPAYVARDKPAAADLKYQREIKSKQPRLKAARRRVDRLTEAIGEISKNKLFDGGPVDQYALAWSKQGQEVAQSKAALLSELTALTRVPGIGSQSDLETRLASLPFPSSEFDPEVNAKAVAEIQAFVADLEDAYGAVEGEFQSQEAPSPLATSVNSGGPRAGSVEDGYRFKGGDPSNPASWEKL